MIHRSELLVATITTLLLAACGGAAPDAANSVDHTVTTGTLDSLPLLTVAPGGLVCLADGRTACPLHNAVAAWLSPTRFALYEPGRPIAAWQIGDSNSVAVGGVGLDQPGMYADPSGVGAGANGEILVAEMSHNSIIHYSSDGDYLRSDSLPRMFGRSNWTFAGSLPLLQRVVAADSVAPATLELRVLKAVGDSAGRVALTHSIPWLHLDNTEFTAPLPMFAIQPRYVFGEDGSLTWSSAEHLWVRQLNPAGGTAWTVTSDITGPPVTPAELAAQRKELESAGNPAIDLDTMEKLAPATHAAVASITLNRDGRVLVGRGNGVRADSTSYLLLSKAGVPSARFTLEQRAQPLLFTGDSLLVRRPTEGEPWEVRWLVLSKAP